MCCAFMWRTELDRWHIERWLLVFILCTTDVCLLLTSTLER